MADPSAFQEWVQTALAAVGGAAASYLGLRKKYSSDSSAIAEDKATSNLMATLMAERDMAMRQAREAWAQRTDDATLIARFEAQLESSERETKRLREEILSLRLHTRKLTAIIVRLDPQAAELLHLDANGDGVDQTGA